MNRIVEIVAMCLGGFSLLAVSFLGFAVLTDAPLDEMAVVGKFFAKKEQTDAEKVLEAEKESAPKTQREVVQSNLGVLSTWELPPPFNAAELEGLETRLKTTLGEYEGRLALLDEREGELEEREGQINEKLENLLEIRKGLDDYRAELDQRSTEVARDEAIAQEARAAEAKAKADLLGAMEVESAARGLVEHYPTEAPLILVQMDAEQARNILASMFESNPDAWKTISEEYARLAALQAR